MLVNVMDKGLVTLPKKVRDKLHIEPGDMLDIDMRDDEIVLRPVRVIPKSQAYFWTEHVQKRIRESEKNIKEGKYKEFTNADELIAELNK